jgi:hypothetical protein
VVVRAVRWWCGRSGGGAGGPVVVRAVRWWCGLGSDFNLARVNRKLLRFYAALSPDQKEATRSERTGLALTEATRDQIGRMLDAFHLQNLLEARTGTLRDTIRFHIRLKPAGDFELHRMKFDSDARLPFPDPVLLRARTREQAEAEARRRFPNGDALKTAPEDQRGGRYIDGRRNGGTRLLGRRRGRNPGTTGLPPGSGDRSGRPTLHRGHREPPGPPGGSLRNDHHRRRHGAKGIQRRRWGRQPGTAQPAGLGPDGQEGSSLYRRRGKSMFEGDQRRADFDCSVGIAVQRDPGNGRREQRVRNRLSRELRS